MKVYISGSMASRPNEYHHAFKKAEEEFEGEVKTMAKFGAFISLKDGIDGLLHISKIKTELKEGDRLKVKVTEIKNGKVSLDLV